MDTQILSATAHETARIAADIIQNGGLVAIPTETVYGLGANGLDPEAVVKIFEAKGRPQDNPLILHVADASQITDFCHSIPDSAWRLAEAFWPGPLTMVLPARDTVPKRTTAGLPTVAVRCPDCAVTRDIIRLAGVPIAAQEDIERTFPLPMDFAKKGEVFMLKVRGESMINAGIFSGDYVIVEQTNVASNGQMVVAMIDDEVTVKTFYKESDHFRLQPENDYMDPIIVTEVAILGKVVGVYRKF